MTPEAGRHLVVKIALFGIGGKLSRYPFSREHSQPIPRVETLRRSPEIGMVLLQPVRGTLSCCSPKFSSPDRAIALSGQHPTKPSTLRKQSKGSREEKIIPPQRNIRGLCRLRKCRFPDHQRQTFQYVEAGRFPKGRGRYRGTLYSSDALRTKRFKSPPPPHPLPTQFSLPRTALAGDLPALVRCGPSFRRGARRVR